MVGIVGYGGYVPRFRIKVEEIASVWGSNPKAIKKGLLVDEKSVSSIDSFPARRPWEWAAPPADRAWSG